MALGDYFSTAIVNHWNSAQHSSESPTDAFGELQFAGSSKRHSYVGDPCAASELLVSLCLQCQLVNVHLLTFILPLTRVSPDEHKATSVMQHSFRLFRIVSSLFPPSVPAAVLGYAPVNGLHHDDGPLGTLCSKLGGVGGGWRRQDQAEDVGTGGHPTGSSQSLPKHR